MSDLYLGLTTLEAAVFAIFAASIFVLIQTATDLFTPVTPHFLLRRWEARGAVAFSFALLVFGLGASVKTTFPDSDFLPLNWQTDYVIDEDWLALGFASAIAVSVALNLYVLVKLISDFRGPGVVGALEDLARRAGIKDWLDFVDPPEPEGTWALLMSIRREVEQSEEQMTREEAEEAMEMRNKKLQQRLRDIRRRQQRGELTDPLGPLFEVAARSIEARRYSVVERSLGAVRKLTADWLGV